MPEYVLSIKVQGQDSASGPLGMAQGALNSLHGALGNILQIAGGNLLAGFLSNVGNAAANMGQHMLDAAADFQMLQIRTEGLIAREMAQGHVIEQMTMQRVGLTKKETDELAKLNDGMARDVTQRDLLAARVREQSQVVWEMTNKWTTQGLATETARARLADMTVQLNDTDTEIARNNARIGELTAKQNNLVPVMQKITVGQMDFAEALNAAGPEGKALTAWIQDLGMKTPFTTKTVASMVTTMMALGLPVEKTKDWAKSMTNFAAGMGLTNEQVGRVTYEMGEMLNIGKLDGVMLRELGRNMVPTNQILDAMAKKHNVTREAMKKMVSEGAVPVTEFLDEFINMTGKEFPNAGERAIRTWQGMTSNIQDFVESLMGSELLGPTLDVLAGKGADIMNKLLKPDVRARFREWGQEIGAFVAGAIPKIEAFVQAALPKVQQFIDDVKTKFGEIRTAWEQGGLTGVIQKITSDIEAKWPDIEKALKPWGDKFWGWVDTVALPAVGNELNKLSNAFIAWGNDPETKKKMTLVGERMADLTMIGFAGIADKMGKVLAAAIPKALEVAGASLSAGGAFGGGVLKAVGDKLESNANAVRAGGDPLLMQWWKQLTAPPAPLPALYSKNGLHSINGAASFLESVDQEAIKSSMAQTGAQAGEGLRAGFEANITQNAAQTAQKTRDDIINALNAAFLIQSPSQVTHYLIGVPLGEGVVTGFGAGLIGLADAGIAAINGLVAQMEGAKMQAVAWFTQLGTDLINGVKSGMIARVNDLIATIRNLLKQLHNAAAGAGLPAGAMAGAMGGIGGAGLPAGAMAGAMGGVGGAWAGSTGSPSAGGARIVYGDTINVRVNDTAAAEMFIEWADARKRERLNGAM